MEDTKPCSIYIVRHGETEWNAQGKLQGHTDIPLAPNGQQQAHQVSQTLLIVHFDAVFSSDFIRARETAEIITKERNIAIQAAQALRERSYGAFEGKSREAFRKLLGDLSTLSEKERFAHKPFPEFESDQEQSARGITFLREVAIGYMGKTVLMVTHAGMMKSLLMHLGHFTYKNVPPDPIENTAYMRLSSDGVDFFVEETKGIKKAL